MNESTPSADDNKHQLYSLIPSLHELLLTPGIAALIDAHARSVVVAAGREVLAQLKQGISHGHYTQASLANELATVHVTIAGQIALGARYRLRRVINATGVVLHTNLGRAPLSAAALAHVANTAGGYSNLEFDLETGERSRREVHTEQLLLRVLTPASEANDLYSALVVNNCAAATFLALNTLAEGGEVIVSRGELVEIGGGFRIPEILAKSGAILREVGTTNRTRLADYENAISPATRLILRVHQSNFSMQGFVERPALRDLVSLGKRSNVPVFDDQGTGLIATLEPLGVASEPTLLQSLQQHCDLLAASGDKLLGGPQCGLLIGGAGLIESIRKNPLCRTYRVDKLTYAALEATLMEYASQRQSNIPVQRMLQADAGEIFRRCEWVSHQVNCVELAAEPIPVQSLIGGGTAPTARLESAAVSLRHPALTPQALLLALRRLEPPVIGRIHDNRVLLDLRTVEPEFDATMTLLLRQIAATPNTAESAVSHDAAMTNASDLK